uniref:TlpA family protein disulfide reductase n=1 Tax=Pedobacter schmidteae TaxID=2201271 RepID=UPI000EADAD49|nr:TlpA disulfide reductase family protein [Pedobacter schmidteae]
MKPLIKKIFKTTFVLAIAALPAQAQLPVQISGLLTKERKPPVKLFKVSNGKPKEIASVIPTTKGEFGFFFYPEYEGFYLVGTGTNMSPQENYKFYFKPGDKLQLSISDTSYVLTGKLNSRENTVMAQWHALIDPLEQKAVNFMGKESTFVDFFPVLEKIAPKVSSFMNTKATGNQKFDKLMKTNMAWDMAGYACGFLNTPRAAHPSVEEYSPYYATLKAQDFAKSTAGIYAQPWGARILSELISVNKRQQNIKFEAGLAGLKTDLDFVPNDTIKGDVLLEKAAFIKTYPTYQEMMGVYGKYLLTKQQQEKGRELLMPLAALKPGDPSFNFSYPDNNEKMVSMKDLLGKVVLIDVWATWCGPCVAQIPYLKKLEEEMKGTDVAFVSISVDKLKDKGTWLKMIKDEKLGGIQLFADSPNDISKYYKIDGIPRFMVFDKKGKIVTINSPRPSDPELKKLLEKTLAEN